MTNCLSRDDLENIIMLLDDGIDFISDEEYRNYLRGLRNKILRILNKINSNGDTEVQNEIY